MRICSFIFILLFAVSSWNLFGQEDIMSMNEEQIKAYMEKMKRIRNEMDPCPEYDAFHEKSKKEFSCSSHDVANIVEEMKLSNKCYILNAKNRKLFAELLNAPEITFYSDPSYEGDTGGISFVTLTPKYLKGDVIKGKDRAKVLESLVKEFDKSNPKASVEGKKYVNRLESKIITITKQSELGKKCEALEKKYPDSFILGFKYIKLKDEIFDCDFKYYACDKTMKELRSYNK